MPFQIHALPTSLTEKMFGLSEHALQNLSAKRVTVDAFPGYPCRVSLEDAAIGEQVILCNYMHLPHDSPFKSSHAIYLREGVTQIKLKTNQVPQALKVRPISLRAFDAAHEMLAAEIAEGEHVADMIEQLLAMHKSSYLHLHYAKPGCFAASVTRAHG